MPGSETGPAADGDFQHEDEALYLHALRLLNSLANLLDEACIAARIDEPLDQAVRAFPFPEDPAFSVDSFHEAIARFVQHLWRNELLCGCDLSESQARDEAVAILEQGYGGAGFTGYDEAVRVAADPSGPGPRAALEMIAGLLKARQRQAYVRWVSARHLEPLSWDTKCAMAAILLERCEGKLPSLVRQMQPAQLADDVLDLLLIDMATSRQLSQPRSFPLR